MYCLELKPCCYDPQGCGSDQRYAGFLDRHHSDKLRQVVAFKASLNLDAAAWGFGQGQTDASINAEVPMQEDEVDPGSGLRWGLLCPNTMNWGGLWFIIWHMLSKEQ